MAGGSTKLCPKCGSVVASHESFCRRCGADVRSGERPFRYELWFHTIHLAGAVLGAALFFFAKGSDLELCGGLIFTVVAASLAVHYRRRPQYRVIKARRRARRLKGRRVAILAPVGDSPIAGRRLRIQARVVYVSVIHRDEIIVRTDSPVSTTTNLRSDFLALLPLKSGDSFTTLLEKGRMRVRIWFVDRTYVSVRRGSLRGRRSLRQNPPLDLGEGLAFLDGTRAGP